VPIARNARHVIHNRLALFYQSIEES